MSELGGSVRSDAQASRPWHWLFLIVSFFAARHELWSQWASPIVGWRPADGGSIALNYYRHGFRFFYPQVFWGYSGDGYVEMEFPLVPYLTALLFKLFGPYEQLQLLLPFAAAFGLVALTYVWGRRRFDASVGFVAAWLVAVTPVLIMLTNTGLWADPPMVVCATLGPYAAYLWATTQNGNRAWLALGVCSIALAALLKLTALYACIPLAWVFAQKYGRVAFLRRPIVWVSGLAILAPSLAWYAHAHELYVTYHNTFGILGKGYLKFGTASLFTSPYFYVRLVRRVSLYHLTPLFTLGFAYGLYRIARLRADFELAWLFTMLVYSAVAAGGIDSGHYHYLLPFLPIGAVTAALGVVTALRSVEAALRPRALWSWYALAACIGLSFIANAAAAERRFVSRDRDIDSATWLKKKQTGQRLKTLTKPDALIVVVDSEMDSVSMERSMTPPDVFYFSDRRGWYLSAAWLNQDKLEDLRARGASVLVVSGQASEDFKARRSDVYEYLNRRYRVLMDDGAGLAYELDAARGRDDLQGTSHARR